MSYDVTVTREGKNWLADVPALPGAHTFAQSLPSLFASVREVIILMDDLPDDAEPKFTVHIGSVVHRPLGRRVNLRADGG